MSVLETNQKSLSLWGASHYLDVPDQCIKIPLALENTSKRVELKLALLTQDNVVRGHDKQRAHELLLNFLDVLIVHVQGVSWRYLVDQHLVRQLHSQAISIDSDLLDVVFATDPDLLLGHQMLNDDIGHDIPVSIPILVQSVHRAEHNLIHHHSPIVAPNDHVVLFWSYRCGPNPIVSLTEIAEVDALATPELDLLVAAA
mmetsp:Transcript_60574/g.174778  ORF Transcript_60574/g.174778 Transcript_60574/m.174778 type:complete len:200 (+) Transcript_60574:2706-3305(+)